MAGRTGGTARRSSGSGASGGRSGAPRRATAQSAKGQKAKNHGGKNQGGKNQGGKSQSAKARTSTAQGAAGQRRGQATPVREERMPAPRILRVGFVPGVEPDRFERRWRAGERRDRLELVPVAWSRQDEALAARECDMCFVRLPLTAEQAEQLHVVELWEERPVVVVGEESVLSLLETVTEAELAEETEIPARDRDDAAERAAVAASGGGYARMPYSLARLHHRKDAVAVPCAEGEPTRIALAWPRDADDALRQEFVGVVRGRTARSSRHNGADGP